MLNKNVEKKTPQTPCTKLHYFVYTPQKCIKKGRSAKKRHAVLEPLGHFYMVVFWSVICISTPQKVGLKHERRTKLYYIVFLSVGSSSSFGSQIPMQNIDQNTV